MRRAIVCLHASHLDRLRRPPIGSGAGCLRRWRRRRLLSGLPGTGVAGRPPSRMKACTSSFVIRPPDPVPRICRQTPCCAPVPGVVPVERP